MSVFFFFVYIVLPICITFFTYYYYKHYILKQNTTIATKQHEEGDEIQQDDEGEGEGEYIGEIESNDYVPSVDEEMMQKLLSYNCVRLEANNNNNNTTNADTGDFDFTNNEVLDSFNAIKRKTACIFGPRAKVWGTPRWEDELTVEENMMKCLPVLANYVKYNKLRYSSENIQYNYLCSENFKIFIDDTYQICWVLSNNDPCGSDFMHAKPPDYTSWALTFGDEAFFVTTFAPCYPVTHPRHSFGVESMFVLMQPESTFFVHKIPIRGTPGTPRAKIRDAFKAIGQPYEHNEPRQMPVASWFVRPLDTNREKLLAGHVTEDNEFGEPVERGYDIVYWWEESITKK